MGIEIDPTSFKEKHERGSPFHSSAHKIFSEVPPCPRQCILNDEGGKVPHDLLSSVVETHESNDQKNKRKR